MCPRFCFALLLVLSTVLAGCKRQDPDAGRRPASAAEGELAQARGELDDRQRKLSEIQARLTRTEAELTEANRRLVREKVENAKLRQELNAWRRKPGH